MRFSLAAVVASAVLLAASVAAQGPIVTNNGQSACVEFGDCTASGNAAVTTETQKQAITPPASSTQFAAPTNAAETQQSLSNQAATGAAAAFSSRFPNGNGGSTGNNGATVAPGTSPSAGSAPVGTATSNAGNADASYRLDTNFAALWTTSVAFVAVVAGALVVL